MKIQNHQNKRSKKNLTKTTRIKMEAMKVTILKAKKMMVKMIKTNQILLDLQFILLNLFIRMVKLKFVLMVLFCLMLNQNLTLITEYLIYMTMITTLMKRGFKTKKTMKISLNKKKKPNFLKMLKLKKQFWMNNMKINWMQNSKMSRI